MKSTKKPFFQIKQQSSDLSTLTARLRSTESKLSESERRVEALAALQSQRWMEFSRMADSMKELSSNMLQRSRSVNNYLDHHLVNQLIVEAL